MAAALLGGSVAAAGQAPIASPAVRGLAPLRGPVRSSAVVLVAGTTVADTLSGLAPSARSADRVHAAAVKHAGALAAADAEARRRLAPVAAEARRLGLDVVGQYTTVALGLLVHGTPDDIAALAGAPGVAAIEPAPRWRRLLRTTVPRIGADLVAERHGLTGEGVTIAVIDSGVDYTHAALGGTGDPAAYAAAASAAERIDDLWDGRPMFPNAVVVGGWDFVGPNYTHPELCPPEDERAGRCTATPHPDPDPIDQHGHGTFVSGAALGRPTGALYRGVAPGARLVALKVFGPPQDLGDTDETIDITIDSIEWCVRVNLGLPVPGVPPPGPIQVANLSLGEPFAQGSRLLDAVFGRAMDAGILVVAAGGNDGDVPFVAAAPGASRSALAVGAVALGETDATDVMAGYSARGPGRPGTFKPDLSAPGYAVSAQMGSGSSGGGASGTSIASPHAAGAAALVWQLDRTGGLGLGALDVGALLVTTARPMPDRDVPVARQGGGRLDVARAVESPVVVRAGDIAALHLGVRALPGPIDDVREMSVRNLTDAPVRLAPSARFRADEDADVGLEVRLPGAPVLVAPKGSARVPVTFALDPREMRAWPWPGTTPFDHGLVDRLEVDGWVTLTPVDDGGAPVAGAVAPSVPFYVLPRPASAVRATSTASAVTLHNDGAADGRVELFVLPDGGRSGDPDEAAVDLELDLRAVGVRYGMTGTLEIGTALHATAPIPYGTALEVYLDVDRDRVIDYRVAAGPVQPGLEQMVVMAQPWDAATGTPMGGPSVAGEALYDLAARAFVVRLQTSALGMAPGSAFDFFVLMRAQDEDWWGRAKVDALPDDYANPCGLRWLTFEPASLRGMPERWSIPVAAGARVEVARRSGSGGRTPGLLALVPTNAPDSQAVLLADGADPETAPPAGVCRSYLPLVTRAAKLRPTSAPDQLFQTAFAATAAQEWAKMTWYLTGGGQTAGGRTYHFRNPDGMSMVWTPEASQTSYHHIRVGNEGFRRSYYMAPNNEYVFGPWECYKVDATMLFWTEWMARLHREFPDYGWKRTGDGSYSGRPTWDLEQTGPGDVLLRVRVDQQWGLILSMSRVQGTVRRDTYAFSEFGVRNVGMSRPLRTPCPP